MEKVIRGILTTFIYGLPFWPREVFCVGRQTMRVFGVYVRVSLPTITILMIIATIIILGTIYTWQLCWILVLLLLVGVEIRFRSMTHDSPGSHLIQYVPNWHYTFREFVRNTKNNQRHEWGRWLARNTNTSAPAGSPYPSIPRSSRVVSWTLNRYWWRWRVKETDTDRKGGWLEVDGVIRIKRHNLSLRRCVSSSFVWGIGNDENDITWVGIGKLKVSMYKSDKNQFQSFWGNFFIAIFGVCQIRFRARRPKSKRMDWYQVGRGMLAGNGTSLLQVQKNTASNWMNTFWGYKLEWVMACLDLENAKWN